MWFAQATAGQIKGNGDPAPMTPSQTECDFRRATDQAYRPVVNWRQVIVACLIALLAALAAARITVHNVAYMAGRHHAQWRNRSSYDAADRARNCRPARHCARRGQRCVSARTASCWPALTATALSGCGTRPPGQAHRLVLPGSSLARANAVAFSPDGSLLAVTGGNGTVWLWDPATGQSHGLVLPGSSPASANAVAFSPAGQPAGRRLRQRHDPVVEHGNRPGRGLALPDRPRWPGRRQRRGVQPGR